MSGEHVGTTSWLNVTSGKSRIWPLETLENQGFVNMQKFPRGKRPRHKMLLHIYNMGGGRTLPSMLGKRISLDVMSTVF
jgi:hypothetical protein